MGNRAVMTDEDLIDWLETAIDDSFDLGWTSRDAAKLIVSRMQSEGLVLIARERVVAWLYRWKVDGEYVNWRVSDASNYHKSLAGYEEVPLYSAPAAISTVSASSTVRVRVLEEALDSVMVGGNHLALLIGVNHPAYGTDHYAALQHYGAGDQYEVWCAWNAIMLARKALGGEHE